MTVGFWSFVFLCVHQTLIGLYCTKEGLCLKPDGELDVGRHLFKKKKFSLSRHTCAKRAKLAKCRFQLQIAWFLD